MKTVLALTTNTCQPTQSPIKAGNTLPAVNSASWLSQGSSSSGHALMASNGVAAGGAPHMPALSAREAARVQRYQQALLRALDQRDREALQHAKAHVLRAAYHRRSSENTASYGMRSALRALVWRMSGMLIASNSRHL